MKQILLTTLFLALALPCAGQEGRWVQVEKSEGLLGLDSMRTDGSIRHCSYWVFVHPDDLAPPDSVFVLTGDSDKEIVDIEPPDTIYYYDRQIWKWEEEWRQRRCEEIWECVRERLSLLEAEIRALKQRINTLEILEQGGEVKIWKDSVTQVLFSVV